MRLSPLEVAAISESVRSLDPAAEVFLYGSRAREDLAGGDIDLIVISEILKFSDKLTLLVELKTRLGDQKFDLVVSTSAHAQVDPFIVHALKSAVLCRP